MLHVVFSFFDRNSPLPCNVILGGSALGFDITPFAQQLLQLGGRRRRGPDPWNFTPLNPGMRGIIPGPGQIPGSGNFVSPLNPAGVLRGGSAARRLYWSKIIHGYINKKYLWWRTFLFVHICNKSCLCYFYRPFISYECIVNRFNHLKDDFVLYVYYTSKQPFCVSHACSE